MSKTKLPKRKLTLARDTLRRISDATLSDVAGGLVRGSDPEWLCGSLSAYVCCVVKPDK